MRQYPDRPCVDIVNRCTDKKEKQRNGRNNMPHSLGEEAFQGYNNSFPCPKTQSPA